MILTHVRDNHLYLAFQDFEDKIEDIYTELNSFPSKTSKIIKRILRENFFENILERQNKYINSISTYIDDIFEGEQQYYFHLFILPKDLDISLNDTLSNDQKMAKIEQLSMKLFKLYSGLNVDSKLIKLFENIKGERFLQLEANFYIHKLEKIYGALINYKSSYKNKIICSDKIIGTEVQELNQLESNPLKNYQFIKASYQRDLIKFLYSTMVFLKEQRLSIFKKLCPHEYIFLMKLINKINNLLLKISGKKNLIKEKIFKKNIDHYLKRYKNKKELQENKRLFKLVESTFFTKLKHDAQFFATIDLPTIFEKVIERRLSNYGDNIFIGDERNSCIKSLVSKNKDQQLNGINYLLSDGVKKIRQYPDFLYKDNIEENIIYHVIDAKYKLRKNLLKVPDDVRQILTYSILFNKEYSQNLINQKNIRKIIIYIEKSIINLDEVENLIFDFSQINVINNESFKIYKDNLFDSEFCYLPIKTFLPN